MYSFELSYEYNSINALFQRKHFTFLYYCDKLISLYSVPGMVLGKQKSIRGIVLNLKLMVER